MVHDHFHRIEARDHVALGHALGETFGDIVDDYVNHARRKPNWSATVDAAAALLPATQRCLPAQIEELEAYAAAAQIPFRDLWAIAIEADFDTSAIERCTTIVTNRGSLIAHNEDWEADSADDVCILKTELPGLTTLEIYYYGCPLGGVALSLSSNGYIQSINSVDHADARIGVPRSMIARAIARIADLDNDLDGLLAIPRASGFAHTLVDRTGRVVSIECSAMRHACHEPRMPFVHTNHYLQPELDDVADNPPSTSSCQRLEAATAMCGPEMMPSELQAVTGDRSAGRKNSICNENTIARGLVDLERRLVSFWLKRESRRGWVDYPIDFIF